MNRSTIMNRRCRTTLAVVSAFLPLTGTTVTIGAVTARPAFARVEDDAKPVAVARSPLVGIALPDGAFRLTDEATLKKVAGWIKLSDGSENQFTLGEPEVLLWGGKGHDAARGKAIKAGLSANLKAAGFNVEVAGKKQTDEGLATLFVAAKSGAKKGVLGFYLASDDYLLLAWADMAPKMAGTMGAARGDAPTIKTAKPTAAAQKKLSAALAKAVEDGTADEVGDLLAKGADPNGNTEGGQSYVQRLIIKGEKEKLATLLEAGADPNRSGDGDSFSPLVTAALTGKVEIIDLLIDKGARVNAARTDGSGTVLHAAAAVGREESVKRLLARGADPKITSKSGKTAREVAEQSGHPEIAELLKKAEEDAG